MIIFKDEVLKVKMKSDICVEPDLTHAELDELTKDSVHTEYDYADGFCLIFCKLPEDKEIEETDKVKKVKDILTPTLELIKTKKLKHFKDIEKEDGLIGSIFG